METLERTPNDDIERGIKILYERIGILCDDDKVLKKLVALSNTHLYQLCQKTALYANLDNKRALSVYDVVKALGTLTNNPLEIYNYVKQQNNANSHEKDGELPGSVNSNQISTEKIVDPKDELVRKRLEKFYNEQKTEEPGFTIPASGRTRFLLQQALGGFNRYKNFFTFVPCPYDHINKLSKKKTYPEKESPKVEEKSFEEIDKEILIDNKLKAGREATDNMNKLHGLYPENFIINSGITQSVNEDEEFQSVEEVTTFETIEYYLNNTHEEVNQPVNEEKGGTENVIEESQKSQDDMEEKGDLNTVLVQNEQSLMTMEPKTRYFYDPVEEESAMKREVDNIIDQIIESIANKEKCKEKEFKETNNSKENEGIRAGELANLHVTTLSQCNEEKNYERKVLLPSILTSEAKKENVRILECRKRARSSSSLEIRPEDAIVDRKDSTCDLTTAPVRDYRKFILKPTIGGPLIFKPHLKTTPKVVIYRNISDSPSLQKKKVIVLRCMEGMPMFKNQLAIQSGGNLNAGSECKTNGAEKAVMIAKSNSEEINSLKSIEEVKDVSTEKDSINEEVKMIPTTEESKETDNTKLLKESKVEEVDDEVCMEEPSNVNIVNDLEKQSLSKDLEKLNEDNVIEETTPPNSVCIVESIDETSTSTLSDEMSPNNNDSRSLRSKKIKEELIDERIKNSKEKGVSFTSKNELITDKSTENNDKWICPICNVSYNEKKTPMVSCDRCMKWHHFRCVGLKKKPAEEDSWYCKECHRIRKSFERKRKYTNDSNDRRGSYKRRIK